jgi:Glyoxalase/Bleomycin resistance protein/Dioxygenase superfamily
MGYRTVGASESQESLLMSIRIDRIMRKALPMALLSSTDTIATQVKKRAPGRSTELRGIHHLALNVEDLKTTLDFYVGILGLPLVHAMTTPDRAQGMPAAHHGRGAPRFAAIPHLFLDMGKSSPFGTPRRRFVHASALRLNDALRISGRSLVRSADCLVIPPSVSLGVLRRCHNIIDQERCPKKEGCQSGHPRE